MKIRSFLTSLALLSAANAANTPPISASWNIAPSGTASTSGELLFRVTPGDGTDATEVTVFVLSGTNDTGVASNIRRALNSQLRADRFNVEPGEGANVLLTNGGRGNGFSIELVDSDVENVRVDVQSAMPTAPPTVPQQATPANPPQTTPATPPAPGAALPPPTNTVPPASESQPASAPPPDNAPPPPDSAPPSGATSPDAPAGGAPASAPPPSLGAR
jgi:hypothetical protein